MHKIIGRGQVEQLVVYALENYLFTNLLSKRGTFTTNAWSQIPNHKYVQLYYPYTSSPCIIQQKSCTAILCPTELCNTSEVPGLFYCDTQRKMKHNIAFTKDLLSAGLWVH